MKLSNIKVTSFGLLITILIVLGVIFQSVAMFRSGRIYDYGVGYWGPLSRDGVWHEALVSQLSKHFPPQNPGLSGTRLLNYHYFYDLGVAVSSRFTGINFRFFIYKFYPLMFSGLLGILTYLLSKKLFKSKLEIAASIFLVYFGSSFGWSLDLIKRQEIGGESSFWSNQPVSMNLNPPFAISLIILILILLSLHKYLKKPTKVTALVLIVLSGTLIGFKVYAAVIVIGGLFLLGIKRFLINNDLRILVIAIISTGLSLAIYLPQADLSKQLLIFEPLWLVNSMIDLTDRVGWVKLSSARVNYQQSGLYVKFLAVEIVGLLIFFIGNLGTRVVAFLGLAKNPKGILNNDLSLFILIGSAISVIIPLLFVQSGNPWNIVQFFYYFLFFSVFWAAGGIRIIYQKLPKKISYIFLSIFFIITPISSVATFKSGLYPKPTGYLPAAEVSALSFLAKKDYGVVLKRPFDQYLKRGLKDPYPLYAYADNSYVSAYSGKEVYIEDEEQQIILGTDYESRAKKARDFFVEKNPLVANKFLKSEGIDYLYLPKVYSLPIAEEEYIMYKIYENDEVNIYKIAK